MGSNASRWAGFALRAFDNPSKSSGISLWQTFASFFVGQPVHSWIIAAVFGVLFLLVLLAKNRNAQIRSLPLFVAFLPGWHTDYWSVKP